MKTSDSVANITKALVESSKKMHHATKDASNPHFRSSYATLESVIDASKDLLSDNGIAVIQAVVDDSLVTRLQHISGEFLESSMKLLLDKNSMQGMGSAISYARRYSLAAMLNISQTDDDGNEASKNINTKSALDGAKAEGVIPSVIPSNLGAYKMKCGNTNVKGKALIDCDQDQLKSAVKYFRDLNKPLTGDVKESIEMAELWFLTIGKKQTEPKLDESEKIPF